MTDNAIIQALRIFPSLKIIVNHNAGYVITVQDILDLINRQKVEIKRLESEAECTDGYAAALVEMTRAEAIKKFAEMVCEGRVSNDPVVIAVRCAVKEMTEGATK